MPNDRIDGAGTTPMTPSIKITKRHDRSLLMLLLHTALRPFKGHVVKLGEPYPAGSPKIWPCKKALKKVNCQERIVEDVRIYDLTVKRAKSGKVEEKKKPLKRLYYFAGGGWQSPATGEHWAMVTEMATKVPNTMVSVVSYPLAPNSPAPQTFPQLMRLYRQIMREADEKGEEVILAGDSAGGNIVLCLIMNALLEDAQKNEELPCPRAILAISPSTDLRRGNPDMKLVESYDPILGIPFIKATACAWRGDWDASDVRVSPLLGDLEPVVKRGVPIHGVTGTYDILAPDAVLFREKCNEAGVQGEWLDWDKQMHVFPLAAAFKLRESVEAKEWILDLLRRI